MCFAGEERGDLDAHRDKSQSTVLRAESCSGVAWRHCCWLMAEGQKRNGWVAGRQRMAGGGERSNEEQPGYARAVPESVAMEESGVGGGQSVECEAR